MQLPVELIRSLKNVPGFDEAAFKAVHESGEQVTSVRINPRKITPAQLVDELSNSNVSTSPIHWCRNGFYMNKRPSFTLDPLLHAGAYYVQEASSMFLWHVLESTIGKETSKLVLDLCAAPGGKSTLLSSFFTEGLIVSNEVIKSRVNILQENVTKWGDGNVVVTNNDSRDFKKLPGFFDVIVTDVPCSGSGLFRRDPSAIEEWSPANVNLCCQRQQRILADVIPSLKKDGILIYSTCSYSKEEDETILDWIIDEFGLESVDIEVPAEWNIIVSSSDKHKANGYRFFPDKLNGEGFFIAVFRQANSTSVSRQKESQLSIAGTKEFETLTQFIEIDPASTIFKQGELFDAFPVKHLSSLRILMNQLYIRQAGIALGSFKGKSFVPEHALATSNIGHRFPVIEVPYNDALSYLRKQDIQPVAQQGWCMVSYKGIGLGWMKVLSSRANNYYPSEWRILKG